MLFLFQMLLRRVCSCSSPSSSRPDAPLKSFPFALASSFDPRTSNTISPGIWLPGPQLQLHLQFKALVSHCQLPGHLRLGAPRGTASQHVRDLWPKPAPPPSSTFTHPPSFQLREPEPSSSPTPPHSLHMQEAEAYSSRLSNGSQPLLPLSPRQLPPPFLATPLDARGPGLQSLFPELFLHHITLAPINPFCPSFPASEIALIIHIPAQDSFVAPSAGTLYTVSIQ